MRVARGKRMKEKVGKEFSFRAKVSAIVIMTLLIMMLIVEAALGFFSDVVLEAVNTLLRHCGY